MGFVGLFSTAPANTAAALVKPSFAAAITRLMPNGQAPLFGMTSRLDTDTAVQTTHGFFTKTMLFPQLTMVGSALSTDTVLNVVSTANVLPGMLLRADVGSFEQLIVNAVISPTQVSVGRAIGTVAAAALSNGNNLYQVGSAYEEGSLRPNALNIIPVQVTNLTQIFRNTWAVTDSMRATLMIAGDTNIAESKRDCMAFHAVDIEKALFFGQKSSGTRNGQPFRTMDGLINIVGNLTYYPASYSAVNVTTAGGTTTYTQLETALDPVFNQTTDATVGNERVLFVGGLARKVISQIGRLLGTYQVLPQQTSYGMQYEQFKISRGTFNMIEHPLFNSNASYSKMAVAVDLSTFNLAYLGDRKTMYKPFNTPGDDATDNGIDAQGGTLTTEVTAIVRNPPANAVIYGLTSGIAG